MAQVRVQPFAVNTQRVNFSGILQRIIPEGGFPLVHRR
jgi:hypothetical protein